MLIAITPTSLAPNITVKKNYKNIPSVIISDGRRTVRESYGFGFTGLDQVLLTTKYSAVFGRVSSPEIHQIFVEAPLPRFD